MRNCPPAPVVLATALFAVGSVFGANYAKYATVTVPGVPDNTTLTDFPLLVRISASSPSGFSYGDFMQNDYSDLRFEDANGNGLAYDVDTWNTDGESLVWVKVPALVKNSEITLRWGSAAPDANDPTDVWSNYAFVWHGDGTDKDATGRARAETPDTNGFFLSADEVTHLGHSYSNGVMSGNAKKIAVSPDPFTNLASVQRYAVSAWIKPTQTEPSIRIISTKQQYQGAGMELMAIKGSGMLLRGHSNAKTVAWPGTNTDYGYQALKKKAWAHVAGVADGASAKIFTNGQFQNGTIDATTQGAGFSICGMGGSGSYDQPSPSHVDEVRLYDGVPADAYLVAEWAQVVSNSYVAIGAATAADTDAAEIAAAPAVVRNQNGTYTISATFTGTAGETYSYAFQLNGTDCDTGSVTLGAAESEKTISWTTDGNVANGTYFASVTVTKGTATALRSAATTFLVGDVGFGTGVNAVEEGLVPGAFVLTRPGDATQPLTVAYSVASGTATAGTSYEAIPGSATFAAGDSSVSIPVVPLNDPALTADAAITLTLSAGLYGIAQGAESTSITLVNWATPTGYNVWIAPAGSDGLASTDGNWSEGRAPVSTDKILLGAWSSENLTWDAAMTRSVASWTQNAEYTGTVTFQITYPGSMIDIGFHLFTVTGDVVLNGGHWVHPVQGPSVKNAATEPDEWYRLNIAVGGDMTIASGVNISAQGRGRGFWIYDNNTKGWRGRAAHAGYVITQTNDMFAAESDPLFTPFGSILAPVATGKGTTSQGDSATDLGHGGGAIHLAITGSLAHEGRIIANGQNSTGATGGSGGSIWISAASISGTGTFEANATAPNGSGAKGAASGGRVSLIATGANSASASNVTANGSRSPDLWQVNNQPYHEGAAGTVWLQSSSAKTLLVCNSCKFNNTECASYIRAYTPIPADDDAATFKAATADATLYVASNGRVRLERGLSFQTLMVRTATSSLAHIDLHGNTLHVGSVVDTGNNPIPNLGNGTYTLADAVANGWTWFEDSVGTGKLVIGEQATLVLFR